MKKEIENAEPGGELLNLPHSFRMAPKLVLFTNYLFRNLFDNPSPYFNEVRPDDLVCAKDEDEPGYAEILLAENGSEITESSLVAGRILRLLEEEKEGITLRNIAVLCRKRDSFLELEESLVKSGIPFTIIGGKGFYQRQTIYDVYNYLSFLLNNENDPALIGILRSPFFNLSDTQLYSIKLQEGSSFFEKLINMSTASEEIRKTAGKLNASNKIAFGMEISALIRKLLLDSGYWTVISAKQNAAQELANIEKLLALARGYSKKSFKNLYDFTVFLKDAIEGFEDEGQAQIARDENTVKILTIHQAKGLEFKAVFLYGCNNTTQDDSVKARSVSFDKYFGILAKVPVKNRYFEKYSMPPVVALFNYVAERKSRAELKRLLYVGVTRAINFLFISASHKEFVPKNNSFLELIAKGFHTGFRTGGINLESEIRFMRLNGGEYDFYNKPGSLIVPIINSIERTIPAAAGKSEEKEFKFNLTKKIKDVPKKEIISATKISIFTQCPVKFQLTYELGFSTIYKLIKDETGGYEFNSGEDDELRPYAQLRGKLIHSALKDELCGDNLRRFITERAALEELSGGGSVKEKLIESVIGEIEKFYKTKSYREIAGSANSRNEFEVYCEEGEHYLYGIIDKLVIEKNRLIIIDYKTDTVKKDQLAGRSTDYIPQLKFYAYILSKLFKEYDKFELRLNFLKHPETPVSYKINRSDLAEFRVHLAEAISKIHSGQFKPDLNHCAKCHFALEKEKCVKSFT
jgi:ATP-dependent helicase/nuclease subunit A